MGERIITFNFIPTTGSDRRCVEGVEESKDVVKEFIKRRRLQLLLHTSLYQYFDTVIVSDSVWDKWALELKKVQECYPRLARDKSLPESSAFADWDGSSGFMLPSHRWRYKAETLLDYKEREV